MPAVTIVLGVALVMLGGIAFRVAAGTHSLALIAAGVGVVFVLLGLVAFKPSLRRHAMHVASMLGLIGFALTVRGLVRFPTLISLQPHPEIDHVEDVIWQSAMAVLCGVYFILCVRSFVAARLRRRT